MVTEILDDFSLLYFSSERSIVLSGEMNMKPIVCWSVIAVFLCGGCNSARIHVSAYNIDQALKAVQRGNLQDPDRALSAARKEAQAIMEATK